MTTSTWRRDGLPGRVEMPPPETGHAAVGTGHLLGHLDGHDIAANLDARTNTHQRLTRSDLVVHVVL